MEVYKDDSDDPLDINKEDRSSKFPTYSITKKLIGDGITENEFEIFKSMLNDMFSTENSEHVKDICLKMMNMVDENENIALLLDSADISSFLISYSNDMRGDPTALASALRVISCSLLYNEKNNIIEQFTDIDFVDTLFFVASECFHIDFLLIPAYECLSMMIQQDSSLLIPFIEKNGLQMLLHNLSHSTETMNVEVEESIGIIAHEIFIAIDEGIKEENGDIVNKLELYHTKIDDF